VEAKIVGLSSLALGLFMLGLSGGCGASKKNADDPSSASDSAAQRTTWKDKSREQRMDWMGLEVFPKMRAIFAEHDATDGPGFACQTCHGGNMEMIDFKMPNRLFQLSRENTLEEARAYDADTTAFMLDRVVPEMAKLLDMEPLDMSVAEPNPAGFGCFGCHPSD
jgi:hypothetical protein